MEKVRKHSLLKAANRSEAGRIAAEARWKGHVKQPTGGGMPGQAGVAPNATAPTASGAAGMASGYVRPEVVKVKTMDEAVKALNEGKIVELEQEGDVHTLLNELARIALDAKAQGRDAPNYDLCKVTVPGTSLFCGQNKGIPRAKMPQLRSKPVAGSKADALPRNQWGEVEGADLFEAHLEKELGIPVESKKVRASSLKATQTDMKGTQVAQMMTDPKFKPDAEEIWVTRDGYILDGHHRWAATVGKDLADGDLGDLDVRVRMIDAPITEVLQIANSWTADMGLRSIAGPATAPNASGSMEPADATQVKKSRNVPTDKKLYERVIAEAKKKFEVYPSAYANGWVVQEYKRRGGKYKVEKASDKRLRDPKGGLTAAGRAHFKRTEGANLKPGVKGAADTPEKMRRKGSFLTRFFTNPSGPMVDEKGKPTRLALSAHAWGEPVPKNMGDAQKLAAKGRRLLARYEETKKSADEGDGEPTCLGCGKGF
jgi:hypothetical protein